MSKAKNLVAENKSKAPWNKALNALDYWHYTYRYFALKDPPESDYVRDLSELQESGPDGLKGALHKNYQEVQNLIQARVDGLAQGYVNRFTKSKVRESIYGDIIKHIENEQHSAFETEREIYEQTIAKNYNIDIPYSYFVQNTYNSFHFFKKPNINKGSVKFENMTSIELWTRAANNALGAANDVDTEGFNFYFSTPEEADVFAFSRIISSKEFSETIKEMGKSSFFSLKNTGIKTNNNLKDDSQNFDKVTADIGEQAIKFIIQGYQQQLERGGIFVLNWDEKEDTNFTNILRKNLNNLMIATAKAFKQIFEKYYERIELKMVSGHNFLQPKIAGNRNKVSFNSNTFGKELVEQLGDAIDSWIETFIELPQQRKKFGAVFYLQLQTKTNTYLKVYSRKYGPKAGIQKQVADKFEQLYNEAHVKDEQEFVEYMNKNIDKQKEVITRVFMAFTKAMDIIHSKAKFGQLTGYGLGNLDIPTFITKCYVGDSKAQYFTNEFDFYKKAKLSMKYGREAIEKLAGSDFGKRKIWQAFRFNNSDILFNAFLRELSSLSDITRILGRYGYISSDHTPFKNTHEKTINDLHFSYNSGEKNKKDKDIYKHIGIEVMKHIDRKKSFTLLPTKNNKHISIFSTTISQYLGYYDTSLLRFITENSGYFDSRDIITKIGINIANHHLAQFYRLKNYNRTMRTNVFYEINNVIYPLTYIYDCMITKLRQAQKNDKVQLLDVQISGYKEKHPPYYQNIYEALNSWKDENWHVGIERKGKLDLSIKATGLKINLMTLNLFQ